MGLFTQLVAKCDQLRFNGGVDDETRTAWELFRETVDWLRENYAQFEFWVERALVWTLQGRLRCLIRARGLPFTVLSDYGMLPGIRRALSADLVVREAGGQVLVAGEFKYEPSHLRPEFCAQPGKLPVVLWGADGVAKDIARIRQFVEAGTARAAFGMFLDEGRHFRKRPPHPLFRVARLGFPTARHPGTFHPVVPVAPTPDRTDCLTLVPEDTV
jgi:hypothetical protein